LPESVAGILVVSAISFVVALVATPLVARWAVVHGWVDRPDGGRKRHRRPVPTVGGVAVVLAFVVSAGSLELVARLTTGGQSLRSLWLPLVISSLALMVLGLVDDARGVRPISKLLIEFAVGIYLFASGFQITAVSNPFGDPIHFGILALPVTLLWLAGMSNAVNLIDGLDGLAAGLSLVSTLGLLVVAAFSGRWDAVLVAAALAGALLGFLPYNFSPARVFLGDCGSLPVGLVLAAIAVHSSIKASAAIVIVVPLLALALPILDVGLAIVRRFVRRRPVFEGDRDHIHHRLVELGLTPRRAAVTLYAVGVLFSALAIAVLMGPRLVVWAALAIMLLVVGLGLRALGYWEVTEIQKSLLNRFVATFRASGEAALRGLEHDLERIQYFPEAWQRLCETAWTLGFTELHLAPRPDHEGHCPELHATDPEPDVDPAARRGELVPVTEAAWSIEVVARRTVVAEVVARRPLQVFDFDPRRFASIVQQLVARHVVERWAEAPGEAAPDGAVSVRIPSSAPDRAP
jgi:UDP-GlcNAc:undecaprenyl-phosphate GlcNAc-1-phosphate transferase